MTKIILLLLIIAEVGAQPVVFPLTASASKKYLIDQNSKPVFLHGDASWRLSYNVTLRETKQYLEDRKAKGYNTLVIEITPDQSGKGGNVPNIYGEYVFHDQDISKPNEKYFMHVDSVLQLCYDMNFTVLLFPLYLGCCHDGWLEILQRQPNTVQKCHDYGKWIVNRYGKFSNIIWVSGGDHNETPESMAFADGIAEADTTHLHSYHADPGNTSTERLPQAKWLTLSFTYTYFPAMDSHWKYHHVYGQLYHEGIRNNRMPSIMFESAYEYERNETTLFLRRQAYWALLSGASGHIFGNRDTWTMNKNWPNALNTPGNQSMQTFHSFVETIHWYTLEPDWSHTVFTSGRGHFNGTTFPGGDDYATGAASKDGSIGILYLPSYRTVCVNMERFTSDVIVQWFDPSTGKYIPVKGVFKNKGVSYFTPPPLNGKGFDDWVLLVKKK